MKSPSIARLDARIDKVLTDVFGFVVDAIVTTQPSTRHLGAANWLQLVLQGRAGVIRKFLNGTFGKCHVLSL
eukprot:3343994-Pleurochrysis_carterae.AAC.1